MVHSDEFHRHAAQLYSLSRGYLVKVGQGETVLLQLPLYKRYGEGCGIYGHTQSHQQIGKTAYVILMAVGDDDAPDLIPVLLHIGEVGYHHVNAGHIAVREGKAAVHDEHIAAALKGGHVLAYLIESPKGDDPYRGALYRLVVGSVARGCISCDLCRGGDPVLLFLCALCALCRL